MLRNYKTFIFITIIYIFSIIFLFKYIESHSNTQIDYVVNQHNLNLKYQYKSMMYHKNISTDTMIEAIKELKNGKVIELFDKASKTKDKKILSKLRDQIEKLLNEKYKYMKKRGVTNLHFVFEDNSSFLRFHKLSKYGDDLSNIRKDFVEVNNNKKILRGLSHGKTEHGFRNIYPIYNKNNKFIGLIDISYPTELLQEILLKINNTHNHFLMDKSLFETTMWDRDDKNIVYHKSSENENYFITFTSNHSKEICITENKIKLENYKKTIADKIQKSKPFGLPVKYNGHHQILSFYPVKDNVSDKVIAWVVSYVDTNEIEMIESKETIIKILIILLVLFVTLFIYLILIQRNMLKNKVEDKTQSLKELNEKLEEKVQERTSQLISSNTQLVNVLDSCELGYWEWNIKTNHLEVNERWLEMIGLERKDFHHNVEDWKQRVHVEDMIKTYRFIKKSFKDKKAFTLEFRMKHKNGNYIWIEASGSAVDFDKDGKPLKVYGIHRDIQNKKDNESKLKEQEKLIQNQLKVNAVSSMLGNIAHQWRQPLSVITSSVSGLKVSQEMLGDISSEQIDKCSDTVMENANYLTRIIDNFRRFFSIDTTHQETLSIETILDTLKQNNKENMRVKSVNCFIDIKQNFELETNLDIVVQSIMNITDNSLDAFDINNIENANRFIFIETSKKDNNCIIVVKDSAGGVKEDIKDKIFEPYFTTKHESIGTGISLYMTYQVITQQLNGTIDVRNVSYKYKG
ncbi:MAG: PAS domain-containing protein, partial [Campylobacterota bacterium]|nr:PAS domain-containing protein [Campylobacterota bacterium]